MVSEALRWVLVSKVSSQLLRLGSNLILTRMLVPEMFGLMALVNAIIIALGMISDIGVKQAIVQRRAPLTDDYLCTAWTMQVVRGGGIFFFAAIVAWPLSLVYEQSSLTLLIPVCALSSVIGGFSPITMTLSERELRLKNIITVEIASQVTGIIVMLALAYFYRSIWALALGGVAASLFALFGNYHFQPKFAHRLLIDWSSFREIYSFGKWMLWSTLATYFCGQGITAIQGTMVSMEQLALLTIAAVFAWVPGEVLMDVLGRVLFPKLAEKQRNEGSEAFNSYFQIFKRYVLLIAFLLFAVLVFISQHLIDFLYDERYSYAGVLLGLLALNGAIAILPTIYQNALLAKGFSKEHFLLMLVAATTRIVGLVVGYWYGGVPFMLAGMASSGVIVYLLGQLYMSRAEVKPSLWDVMYLVIILCAYATTLASMQLGADSN